MPAVAPSVAQVPRLTTDQIAQFKRDGFLILPNVIDPQICQQAREHMWNTIAEYRPSMKRDDPSTWLPFTKQESSSYESQRPADGGEPYFTGSGHGMKIYNGSEDLMLNIGARPLWDIAEQLMGKGQVTWPAGLDASDHTTGPCLMTEDTVGTMAVHLGPKSANWTDAIGKTQELRLPKSGPHWMTGQGTRGMYCTLPNGKAPTGIYPHAVAQPDGPYARAHCGEGLYESRWKLQTSVYFDDVPPGAGGTLLWPGSHKRIWDTYQSIYRGDTLIDINCLSLRNTKHRPDGYVAPPVPDIKADTDPVDTHGPAGSVVLWHSIMLHMAGTNTSSDVIRQATLYAFAKTPESVPDARAMADPTWDIWDDWSEEVRAVST
jgi:hypothetical protein